MRNWLAIASAFGFLCLGCSGDRLAGGTGEETTNGRVAGMVVYPGGNPAPKAQVKLIPTSYDPVKDNATLALDTTDDSGRYVFTAVPYGTYTIQSVHCIERTRAIAFGITVVKASAPPAALTLQRPGAIKVALTGGAQAANGYVYVPGSDVAALVNGADGFFLLDSVPAGSMPSVNYATKGDTATSVIRYDVRVVSGDTCTILNPSWRHARPLALNTTSSGAGVAENVTNFPVLVRLTQNNFDFSEAQATGDDLRFTKADSTPLPLEIERWDPVAGFAEVWVKVDTVHGNDSTRGIIMYWGASTSSATSLSDGAAVFDTSEGFQAVLHMELSGSGKIPDATANHYDGTPSGAIGGGPVNGPVGTAWNFTGSSGNIQLTGTAKSKLSFPQYGTYTIAAWVNVDTLFAGDQHLVGKGGLQYSLRVKGALSSPPAMFSFEEYVVSPLKGLDRRLSPVTLSEWKYVVAVRNGTSAYLYVDGICTDSMGIFYGDNNPSNSRDSGSDVTIGSLIGGGLHFNGSIDEVRILSVPHSPDWIKLCYMNQRSDDKLVIFK